MPISHPARPKPATTRPVLILGRGSAVTAAIGVAVLSIWSAASAWYITAHDDIAQHLFVSEAEASYGYQDRIKTLQDQLEREVTRNLVEHNGVSNRIEKLSSRQVEIEAKQAWLARITTRNPLAEGAPSSRSTTAGLASAPRLAPGYAGNAEAQSPSTAEPYALRLRDEPSDNGDRAKEQPTGRVSLIERSLDGVEAAELELVQQMTRYLDLKVSRIRTALAATGLDVDRLPTTPESIGGPLVPLAADRAADGRFGPLAAALESQYGDFGRLLDSARRLPIGRPLTGELDQTSPFGYRFDPFTRTPALHTGVDLRAEWGAPVRATAAGRVSIAEATGGYGNLVEIDHGGGLVTRYGHLSAFLVTPGQRVEAGQTIARAGSTGRSTGAHLHYETRINGEPVDPTRFLSAGRLLAMGDVSAE